MGFDNECIPNIQSLPGEYFCPVCRLLVYPNEALQSQCSHLYCKPCLTYIVSTTRACPYDGYLVTEADSKPLIESNKAFAEAIGKIVVHCLYHRSGCTWQGPLSECTMHCSGCAFGNSPVVCNRCSIQIVHRQVQEHAQNCPGVQLQPQQIEGSQAAAAMGTTATGDQTQTTTQVGATTSQLGMTVSQVGTTASETQTSQTAAAPAQDPSQPVSSNSQVQAVSAAASTQEQWYQQYYQQYPGYDAYQQHYQQYYPYQQQAVQQYQQQPLQAHTPQMAGQHQAQVYMQPLAPQPQLSVQPQPQVQPQILPQSQLQPFGQPQSRPPVPAPVVSQSQNQVQVNPLPQAQPTVLPHSQVPLQTHAPSQGPPHLQTQPSSQSYSNQHPPQHMQMPQYQQPNAQMKHLQTHFQPQAFSQLHPQHHPVSQTQALPQPQVQLHSQPHSLQPNLPLNPNVQSQTQQSSGHAVTGHLSYPQPQPHQQMQLGASQHAPMHPQGGPQFGLQRPVQAQYPQHTAHLRPPQSHAAMPNQQKPALLPSPGQALNGPSAPLQPFHLHAQQPAVHQRPGVQPVQQAMPQQYVQQQPFHSQPSGSFHNQLHLQVPSVQQQLPVQSQLRPQGPHQPIQQFPQQEQNVHSMQPHQPQNLTGPLMRPNHGLQVQPYQQSANVVQGRPMQLGPTQPSSGQSDALRTKNQVQVSSEQQSGATLKPMSEKPGDHMIDRSADEREAAALSGKASKKEINELNTASGFGNDATELKTLKLENDVNPVDEEVKSKAEIENKCTPVVTCAKEMPESEHVLGADPEAHAAENVMPVTKHIAKEEAPVSTEKLGEHSVLDDKKIQDVPLRKPSPLQEAEHLEEDGGRLQKDKTLPQMQGVTQGPGFHPSAQMQVGGVITNQGRHQSAVNHGTCTFQQRPDVPLQGPPGPPPHLQAAGQLPTQFMPHEPGRVFHLGKPLIPHGPDVPPSGTPAAAPASMSGRGPGQYGLPQHGFEPQLVSSQLPSHAPTISSSALDSHGAMMARAPLHGPESQFGPVTNPAEGESFRNQRSGCMDGGKPDSLRPVSMELGPLGQPSGMYSSAFGLKDERFKPLPDKCSDPFLVEPARHVIDRGEFEGNVKQFPRSSHLDVEPVPKFGPYFSSSRPLDSSPHGFSMDVPPRAHEKGLHGLNFDTGSKLDHMAGSVHSRFLPPYNDSGVRPVVLREDAKGRSETAHFHPDFLGPVPGFGRRHMDALNPRSPNREYSGISSHGFGGLEDIDGREQHHFGFSSHFRRGEFEGPGNFRMGEHMRTGGLFGPDVLPSHARRGEHLGPRGMPGHPRLGEPVGFGAFQGHARMGEAGGPGNIPHPRLGEPGFRSSYSLQGYPNDGIYTGDAESFESSRKRKPVSMGWCRICNVDCETVEGLDVHSQTREHQKRAMDMVLIIKQNAKKHKPDYASLDGASKPRNANFEGRAT